MSSTSKEQANSAPLFKRLVLSYGAALVAESITYPLDITKTRLQLQGEGAKSSSRLGMFRMALSIAQKEGASALFKGLPPALIRHAVYSPIRIVGYEQARRALAEWNGTSVHELAMWQRGLCGAGSGMIGQLIASPADLVKVNMQAAGRGAGVHYGSVAQCFGALVRENGVAGLWRGAVPNIQRAMLVNLGELAAYDASKQALLGTGHFRDNVVTHGIAAFISGFFSAGISSPADLIKSRIMAAPRTADSTAPLYRGTLDCLRKTVRAEGVFALFKGFVPAWLRLAPWQFAFWCTYEQLLKLSGSQSF
jgi:solute carrier family 25 (mitochondrial uncoupling protein), member 27